MRVCYPFRDGLLIVCRWRHVLECLRFDHFQGVEGKRWGCGEGEKGVYGWWVFRRVSKIILENMEWLSLGWLLAACLAWM